MQFWAVVQGPLVTVLLGTPPLFQGVNDRFQWPVQDGQLTCFCCWNGAWSLVLS